MVNDDLKTVTVDGEPVKLTPIEYNILVLIILLPVYIPQVSEIKTPIIAFCFNALMGVFYVFL